MWLVVIQKAKTNQTNLLIDLSIEDLKSLTLSYLISHHQNKKCISSFFLSLFSENIFFSTEYLTIAMDTKRKKDKERRVMTTSWLVNFQRLAHVFETEDFK